jgi:hypothetical protein
MNCKNCNVILPEEAGYCPDCGAKIVNERPQMLEIIKAFIKFIFNWDNSYVRTFTDLFIRPHQVMHAYISGVRKRYVSPIVFLAVCTAFGMLVYNSLSDEYIKITENINEAQLEFFENLNAEEGKKSPIMDREQMKKENEENMRFYLKYFNLFSFLVMPLYTLMSFLVFGWEKFNFAEHFIINSYLQGLGLFVGAILFIIGIYTTPSLSIYALFLLAVYYLITYSKLLHLGFGQLVLKFLLFLLVLLGVVILTLIGVVLHLFIGNA